MTSGKRNNVTGALRCTLIAAASLALFSMPGSRALAFERNESAQAAVAPSRLRITGDKSAFTVDADHADVLSCLKSLFSQAGKQFDADTTVGGQVTLQLTAQPLEVVLSSVCKQAFVKYRVDSSTGIWHFEADDAAIKMAFKRIQDLNDNLKQQLRALGLDVPQAPGIAGEFYTGFRASANSAASAPAMRGGAQGLGANGAAGPSAAGGFGGGITQQKAASRANPAQSALATGVTNGAQAQAVPGGGRYFDGGIKTDFLPDSFVKQFLAAGSVANNGSITPEEFQKQYGVFLKQNGLVAINTNGNAVAMSDLFAELSRQAGTPILLDPSVPRGSKFRINLSLPACTLAEALNIILPAAHLRWHTLNGTTYISATPDFQLFFGSQLNPGVIYGNTGNTQQGGQRGALQNSTNNSKQN